MSSNGYILHKELDAYFGVYTELKPYENPVTTIAGAKGIRELSNKEYSLVFHTNAEQSSINAKADAASPTLGSSTVTTGSNTAQILFEGAAVTWARLGDQNLGRVLGWQDPSNPSVEPSPMARAEAEALAKIKSQLEWVSREGVYAIPHAGTTSGTTGTWQQRGIRFSDGMQQGTATGAVVEVGGGGTTGTFGTLDFDVLMDTLQGIWDKRLWENGRPMVAVCNSTVKRALTDIMKTEFNFGKNGLSINRAGVNLTEFDTDFGPVQIVLTHNFPEHDLYFYNFDYMDLVGRPVPGKGFLFKTDIPQTIAAEQTAFYTEQGLDYRTGSAHGRITAIGSTVKGGVDADQ